MTRAFRVRREAEARERSALVAGIASDQLRKPTAGLRPVVSTVLHVAQDVERSWGGRVGGVAVAESRQGGYRRRIAEAHQYARAAVDRERPRSGVTRGGVVRADRLAQAPGRYEQLAVEQERRGTRVTRAERVLQMNAGIAHGRP